MKQYPSEAYEYAFAPGEKRDEVFHQAIQAGANAAQLYARSQAWELSKSEHKLNKQFADAANQAGEEAALLIQALPAMVDLVAPLLASSGLLKNDPPSLAELLEAIKTLKASVTQE